MKKNLGHNIRELNRNNIFRNRTLKNKARFNLKLLYNALLYAYEYIILPSRSRTQKWKTYNYILFLFIHKYTLKLPREDPYRIR